MFERTVQELRCLDRVKCHAELGYSIFHSITIGEILLKSDLSLFDCRLCCYSYSVDLEFTIRSILVD